MKATTSFVILIFVHGTFMYYLLISTVCPSFISMICPSIFTGLREVCISRNKNVPINVYFTDNFVANVVNDTSDITGHCMIVDAVIEMSEFIGRIVQF